MGRCHSLTKTFLALELVHFIQWRHLEIQVHFMLRIFKSLLSFNDIFISLFFSVSHMHNDTASYQELKYRIRYPKP